MTAARRYRELLVLPSSALLERNLLPFFVFQCFYIPKCRKDYAATLALIQDISERLRAQHTVQCFVDPAERADSAIFTQIYGRVAVFHSLFWPSCTLVCGTVIIAMVKLTQYLSFMCERLNRIKT